MNQKNYGLVMKLNQKNEEAESIAEGLPPDGGAGTGGDGLFDHDPAAMIDLGSKLGGNGQPIIVMMTTEQLFALKFGLVLDYCDTDKYQTKLSDAFHINWDEFEDTHNDERAQTLNQIPNVAGGGSAPDGVGPVAIWNGIEYDKDEHMDEKDMCGSKISNKDRNDIVDGWESTDDHVLMEIVVGAVESTDSKQEFLKRMKWLGVHSPESVSHVLSMEINRLNKRYSSLEAQLDEK